MLPNKELSSASELAQRQFRKFNYLSQMIVRRRCSECGTSNFCAVENKLSLLVGKVVLGSEDSDRYALCSRCQSMEGGWRYIATHVRLAIDFSAYAMHFHHAHTRLVRTWLPNLVRFSLCQLMRTCGSFNFVYSYMYHAYRRTNQLV